MSLRVHKNGMKKTSLSSFQYLVCRGFLLLDKISCTTHSLMSFIVQISINLGLLKVISTSGQLMIVHFDCEWCVMFFCLGSPTDWVHRMTPNSSSVRHVSLSPHAQKLRARLTVSKMPAGIHWFKFAEHSFCRAIELPSLFCSLVSCVYFSYLHNAFDPHRAYKMWAL